MVKSTVLGGVMRCGLVNVTEVVEERTVFVFRIEV
jgi:hypothetical protein